MSNAEFVDYKEQGRKRSTNLLKNSPIYTAFLSVFTTYLNKEQADLIWLSENLMNLDVAEKYHLDIIGGIVGQSRLLASFDTGVYFGFKNSYQSDTLGDENNPAIGGVWLHGEGFNTETALTLSDEVYKRVIEARIIKNNTFNCCHNDLIKVVNLLTDRTDNVIYTQTNGKIVFQVNEDKDGLLNYFLSRVSSKDNILPIPFGVEIQAI